MNIPKTPLTSFLKCHPTPGLLYPLTVPLAQTLPVERILWVGALPRTGGYDR